MGEIMAPDAAQIAALPRPSGFGRERIVVCDYSGHPFQVQLSRELGRRGHAVQHLYFAEFQSPKGQLQRLNSDPKSFSVDSVSLGRAFSKYNLVRRRYQEIEIGRRFTAKVAAFAPDVVIGCNMPLDALRQLAEGSKRDGSRFIFWQQDIYSFAIQKILSRKYGPAGTLVGRYYRRLEKAALETADSIVVISTDFVSTLAREFGVPNTKVRVVENWACLDEIRPLPKDNAWSRGQGVQDREVVLYTGTLGMKHDPSLLLDLARALQQRSNAILIVASEGPAAEWLAREAAGLHSLRVLPFQAYAEYSQVLASADVLVAILEPDAGAFSVPSKVLSYLCAGRPIVLSAPPSNLSSRTIRASGAGVAVPAESREEFVRSVTALLDDGDHRVRCGKSARGYAEDNFNIENIADHFIEIISGSSGHRANSWLPA